MSDLTPCNYCTLTRIKFNAAKVDKKVILIHSNFMGGTDVFVVPKDMNKVPDYREPSSEFPNGCEVYQKYHASWLMSIPDHCCC